MLTCKNKVCVVTTTSYRESTSPAMTARDLLSLMQKTFLITTPVVQQILPVDSVVTVLMVHKQRSELRIVSAAFWFLGKYECIKWA